MTQKQVVDILAWYRYSVQHNKQPCFHREHIDRDEDLLTIEAVLIPALAKSKKYKHVYTYWIDRIAKMREMRAYFSR